VTLFWFVVHGNKKFSTTSPVHGAVKHFKTKTGAAPAELMCQCSMQLGAIVLLAMTRGTAINRDKEHQRISFFSKAPKVGSITAEPKANKGPSGHWRFNLLSIKHRISLPNLAALCNFSRPSTKVE
jgi:hypothetical protein